MSHGTGRRLVSTRRLLLLPAVALLFGGAAFLVSAPGSVYTSEQKAAYLSEKDVSFVRPGLIIKITGAEIAQDGTIRARVKLTDLRGLPLDRDGIETPGSVSTSLIAAYIPANESQYRAYTTRVQTSPITGQSATQAGSDSGGVWTKVAVGEYTYTFARKADPANRGLTHSIGAYGSRNLSEFDLGTQYDDDVFNFVPDGSPVRAVRDVIRTATCNKCHYDMGFHGGSRKTMELCNLCHTPQTVDPDTGNTVDMPVMTHRIHMGSSLPSVQAGKKYIIIGNSQSVHDYSGIAFPADIRSCTKCHESGPPQADAMFKPSRAACGSCHDDVNFATGQNHANLPQVSDNQCSNCHTKQGELDFDVSVMGAHTIPRMSRMLPGVEIKIVDVAGAAPGKPITATFTIKDKSGKPIAPADMARLNFRLGGPNSDIRTLISEDARRAQGSNGTYFWTFAAPLPANAAGSWTLSLEGRTEIKVLPGTAKEQTIRDTGINSTVAFTVDGKPVQQRRQVVTNEKCNACHGALAFHGDARNTVENCVVCHNGTLVAGTGAAAAPVSLQVMVHRIHAGHSLTREYKIGNTSFNHVGYPGRLQACSQCHVNNSQFLPLPAGVGAVADPNGPLQPLMAESAACSGCHDSFAAASHMKANTTSLGESCATCHSSTSEFSVARVHAQ